METETVVFTDEKRAEIRKMKSELKALAAEQKKDKTQLRQDHRKIHPVDGWSGMPGASFIQSQVRARAYKITRLHIEYNKARDKPYDMHYYRG